MPPISSPAIVVAARGWVGTRFQHQGRVKRTASHPGGVDCLGLLIGVAAECGLKGRNGAPLAGCDVSGYGHAPDPHTLRRALEAHLHPCPSDALRPGHIVLFAIEGEARHLGILSDYAPGVPGLIHAYAPARKVCEHVLDIQWKRRIRGVFQVLLEQ